MRKFLLAGLLGAGLAYLLDPKAGTRRRNVTRDKLFSLSRSVNRSVRRRAQYAANIRKAAAPHAPDNPNPDDLTLRDRVESEVFRDPGVPKGEFNINVVDGVVELRGQLSSQQEIDDLIQKVRGVPDVQGVHSYLHLPGTPAPNKAEAIRVS